MSNLYIGIRHKYIYNTDRLVYEWVVHFGLVRGTGIYLSHFAPTVVVASLVVLCAFAWNSLWDGMGVGVKCFNSWLINSSFGIGGYWIRGLRFC